MKPNTTGAPVKMIGVLGQTEARRTAIVSVLASKYPHADFKHITKFSELPPGASVASIGMPGFLNVSQATEVIVVNTRFVADQVARDAQRALLNNKETTAEQLIGELTTGEPVVVLPGREMDRLNGEIGEARMTLLELSAGEPTKDEMIKAQQNLLSVYKTAFATIRATGMIAPLPAEEKKDQTEPDPAAADETPEGDGAVDNDNAVDV